MDFFKKKTNIDFMGKRKPILAISTLAVLVSLIPLVRPLRGRDYWIFAQAYERQGSMRAAVAAYEAAVREEADDGSLLNNLGVAYRAVGDNERAAHAFRSAVRADPRLALPHKNLGMVLISQGDLNGGLAQLMAALQLNPNDAQALGAIGGILAEQGDRAGAKAAFSKARALAPTDTRLSQLIEYYEHRENRAGGRTDARE